MNISKLIKTFNTPETVLIISDYPERTLHGEKNYGIAWHTKRLIEPIAQGHGGKFVVLAEKGLENKPELHCNGNVLVLRVFDPKHHTLFPTVLIWLFRFHKIRNVHVHSEFCANGGIWNQALIAPFLILIKLTQRRVTYYAHNIVTSLKGISKHLNLNTKSISYHAISAGIGFYYRFLNLLIDRWIVMDEVIQSRLKTFVPDNKILLLPFFLQQKKKSISKTAARKQLGIDPDKKILLSFGFVTYYKGADWIVRAFTKLKKQKKLNKFQLILAGGEAYSLKSKQYYRDYYQNVLQMSSKEKDITLTGFIPEADIDLYFAAADLVILPYRGLIGASATLTKTIEYEKPFLLSNQMGSILQSADLSNLLMQSGLSQKDLTFDYSSKYIAKAIENVLKPHNLKKISILNKSIIKSRSKEVLTNKYLKELSQSSSIIKQWRFDVRKLLYAH